MPITAIDGHTIGSRKTRADNEKLQEAFNRQIPSGCYGVTFGNEKCVVFDRSDW